jgi:hypothetical protein
VQKFSSNGLLFFNTPYAGDILEINLLIQRDNLKNGKWKKPIPAFKGASYEILQLFNKKFSIQTQNY